MKSKETEMLKLKINQILDWSPMDASTREVLRSLMKEVVEFVEKNIR